MGKGTTRQIMHRSRKFVVSNDFKRSYCSIKSLIYSPVKLPFSYDVKFILEVVDLFYVKFWRLGNHFMGYNFEILASVGSKSRSFDSTLVIKWSSILWTRGTGCRLVLVADADDFLGEVKQNTVDFCANQSKFMNNNS